MTQSVLVNSNCVGVLIFELSYQSRVNNFYRANFYPDISSGLAQLHQFLSGKMPPAFRQNSKISIRTDLWNFKKFRQFLSGSGHGIWGHFPGSFFWSNVSKLHNVIIGMVRYFTIQTALSKGMFPATRSAIVAVAFVLATIVTVTFGTLLGTL